MNLYWTWLKFSFSTFWIGLQNRDIGRANLEETRKGGKTTRYIRTLTNQRIEWIEKLRQDIAAFISLVNECSKEGDKPFELDRLRHVIRLRLNPKGDIDKDIRTLIDEAYDLSYKTRPTDTEMRGYIRGKTDKLTKRSQDLLKEE